VQSRPLFRCFDRKYLMGVLLAAVLIAVGAVVGAGLAPRSGARLAIAAVQGLAVAWTVLVTARALRRLDELQLRIHLEALALAFGATVFGGTAWSFLEQAGLPRLDYGAWLWPAMAALWAFAILARARRYR
jgi:hypothetical protein